MHERSDPQGVETSRNLADEVSIVGIIDADVIARRDGFGYIEKRMY